MHIQKAFKNERLLKELTGMVYYLVIRFTSPDNANGELVSTQEMQTIKGKLLKQQTELQEVLQEEGKEMAEWVELSEQTFNFARYA
jgi:hypothetical protein